LTGGLDVRTDIDPDLWDSFVNAQENATFFHRAGWQRVAAGAFHHRIYPLGALREARLVGVLPLVEVKSRLFGHALISNAFCVSGGPLAVDEPAREVLLRRAVNLGRELGVDYIELRDTSHIESDWTPQTGLYEGFERAIASSEDECLRQIPRKQRAVLRKALGQGFSVTIDQDVGAFFAVYARTMRNHGTPAFPRRYFESLTAVFGSDVDILTVWDGGKPLSAVLSFYFRDRVLPYYTGSANGARATGANDLMYWHLMRHAAARGCTTFDFGRSKVGTGAHAFKRNWGFEPRPITHWFYLCRCRSLPNVNPTNPRLAPLIAVWRQLPLPLATFLSRYVSGSLA
jgi:FemAB-related protein (PEP-CTERM system-associated)